MHLFGLLLVRHWCASLEVGKNETNQNLGCVCFYFILLFGVFPSFRWYWNLDKFSRHRRRCCSLNQKTMIFFFCFAFPVSHSGHLVAPGMWTLEEREEVNDVRIGTAIITTLSTAGHTGVSSLRQPIAVNETQRHFWTFLKKENGNGMKEDCNPVNWIQSTTWMQTSYSLSVSTRWWRMMAMHLTCGKVK